jgi:type II secretory pathway pseudopilin PulG
MSESPSPTRRWFRFSLISLLTVVAIVGLGAAYVSISLQLARTDRLLQDAQLKSQAQQREIDKLRSELGLITVTEPTKIHILALATLDEHHWKWRVYLPATASSSHALKLAIGKIPATGFDAKTVGECHLGATGELTVEAFLRRDQAGKNVFTVQVPGMAVKLNRNLTDQQAEELSRGTNLEVAGTGTTEIIDNAGPIRLLRERVPQPDPNRPGQVIYDGGEPSFGILLWLQ